MNEFSFMKGWSQVKQGEASAVRKKIMTRLKITTRSAFLERLHGKIEPRVSEHRAITEIFKEHKITDVWGE